tara:strand:+ start:434 stop:820 length:387 start_codon:yes stop_codon:yes gene_type:complete
MQNERHYSVNEKGQRTVNKFYVKPEGKSKMYFIDYHDQMEAVNFYSITKGLSVSYGQEYEVVNAQIKLTEHQQKVFKSIVKDGKRTQELSFNDTTKAIIEKGFLKVSKPYTTNEGSRYEMEVVDLMPC